MDNFCFSSLIAVVLVGQSRNTVTDKEISDCLSRLHLNLSQKLQLTEWLSYLGVLRCDEEEMKHFYSEYFECTLINPIVK